MPNYTYTNAVGSKRRRAKGVNILNPNSLNGWTPSLVFLEEDRLIMEDGEEFKDAGLLTLAITPTILQKQYPRLDIETALPIPNSTPRTGAELLKLAFDLLADIYVTEAQERDSRVAGEYTDNSSMSLENPTGSGSYRD